jgi:HEAT repeat protein
LHSLKALLCLGISWVYHPEPGRATRSNFAIPHLLPYLGIDDFDLQYTLNRALERINSEDLVAALTKTISDKNPMTRIASIAALTNTPSQEAVRALRKALRHESPKTRWSAVAALGNVGSLEAEEDLLLALSDPSPNVVRQAAIALGKLASEKSVHFIFEKLQESSSIDGISFAHALASIGGEKVITALIKLYLEGDRLDFIIPAIEQAEIPQEAISIILEALNLEYTSAQINAIIAIGELELKLAVPHLMVLAHSEDYEIQGAVIEALGKLKAFEAKDLLIEKLEEKNYWTVTKAAVAVGRLNAKEAIPKLKSLLYDKKNHVREDILYALSLMNDMEAWSGILDMLEDENVHTRRIAISTLKSSNHEEVANDSRLLLILRSENNELTLADALEILGTSKFDSKFSVLESFLEHPDSIVRRGAINGLRTSSERKAVNLLREKVLCKLIDDSVVLDNDDLTFVEAAHAIGEIGDSEDLPFLIQILKKTSTEYFLEAILNIQSRCKFYNYEVSQQGDSASTQNEKEIANTITIQTVEKLIVMSDKAPIFNQQHATIGVNYAAEGSRQEFAQHIHAPEQNFEILLTGYKHFIDELQQQNPHVTNETAIIQTIDIEARRIDTRWQNFLNLKRLWNGGKRAAIRVGEHFVESNLWGKGAIAFLEGVSEDVK